MAKSVQKIRVIKANNPRIVKYLIPRLAHNKMYMRENGFVIDDEPESMESLSDAQPSEPITTKKGDESKVNEYAELNARDLVSKIESMTNVKVLEQIEAMELNRGDDARKTVLKALDKRFKNISK